MVVIFLIVMLLCGCQKATRVEMSEKFHMK